VKTLICFGTRPEYLKIKPLLLDNPELDTLFVKQHVDIINFGEPTHSIEVKNECQNRLNSIFQQVLLKAEKILENYDNIVVQGDTATVAAIALTAYNLKKKIFYIESGLRSFDLENPYPEEAYRQMVSRIATVNFCPTNLSSENLKKEKVLGDIFVTGNTSLDNLVDHQKNCTYGKYVLVTLHRNENLNYLTEWVKKIDEVAKIYFRYNFIYPVHPNPIIKEAVKNAKYIKKVEPLEHLDFIKILKNCSTVITDSGGIQEEGSFLGKKIIVCRKTTERPEGIETGHLFLCGDPKDLSKTFETVMRDFTIDTPCPYGDGNAASKINNILARYE
jgi:UDP-N-acetylglucosamine 2-epimerase (non-hydrolysing)